MLGSSEANQPLPEGMGAVQASVLAEDLRPRCCQLLHHRPLLPPFVLLPVFSEDLAGPSLLLICLCSKELPPGIRTQVVMTVRCIPGQEGSACAPPAF